MIQKPASSLLKVYFSIIICQDNLNQLVVRGFVGLAKNLIHYKNKIKKHLNRYINTTSNSRAPKNLFETFHLHSEQRLY